MILVEGRGAYEVRRNSFLENVAILSLSFRRNFDDFGVSKPVYQPRSSSGSSTVYEGLIM